jgi:S-adenosylmethionine synthetase
VEVVERKGVGHPDTICDGIAEHVCVCLCRYYLERFGQILHHNVDKVLLVGGSARPAFSGGHVVDIEIYLAGRATQTYCNTQIPVHEIAVEASREWVAAHLPGLNVDTDVRIVSRLHPGSTELVRLVSASNSLPRANDTSCGAGFAPLTDLERVVVPSSNPISALHGACAYQKPHGCPSRRL